MNPGGPVIEVIEEGEPVAVITRMSAHTFRVHVRHGISQWGPDGYGWRVWGWKRAQRKARKALVLYRREQARRAEVWEVRDAAP